MANDAVAVALAITAAEPALAQGLSATIMVGHGIGMGVVADGEARWGAGSEIGHVKLAPNGPQCRCGQRGCIEAYLADYALYRDARTFLDLPPAASQQPSEGRWPCCASAHWAAIHVSSIYSSRQVARLRRRSPQRYPCCAHTMSSWRVRPAWHST